MNYVSVISTAKERCEQQAAHLLPYIGRVYMHTRAALRSQGVYLSSTSGGLVRRDSVFLLALDAYENALLMVPLLPHPKGGHYVVPDNNERKRAALLRRIASGQQTTLVLSLERVQETLRPATLAELAGERNSSATANRRP